jgi:hypothetical protein
MNYVVTDYHGYECREFEFMGRSAKLVCPKVKPNGNWALKTEYFTAFPDTELELLSRGWHIAYNQNIHRWAEPEDLKRKAAFVEFISKETALEMIKDILPEKDVDYFAVLEEAGENPMSDGAKVTMVDLEKFDATVSAITSTKGVDSIQSQNGLAEKITGIKNGIFIAGIAIITILLIISLVMFPTPSALQCITASLK